MTKAMFPETIPVCYRRIEANSNLVKAMVEKPSLHVMYEPALYAAARRCAHFAFYLQPDLRV